MSSQKSTVCVCFELRNYKGIYAEYLYESLPENFASGTLNKIKQFVDEFILANGCNTTYAIELRGGEGYLYADSDLLGCFTFNYGSLYSSPSIVSDPVSDEELFSRVEKGLCWFFDIEKPVVLLRKVE